LTSTTFPPPPPPPPLVPITTADWSEIADDLPLLFVAVTLTRIVLSTSALATV
jgi:hypothetical protein